MVHEDFAAPGPGPTFGASVRGFDYDGLGVTPIARINFFAYAGFVMGAELALVDLDASGTAEILTGPGAAPANPTEVRGFGYDGARIDPLPGLAFEAYPGESYGVRVAGGDLEGDGLGELVTALVDAGLRIESLVEHPWLEWSADFLVERPGTGRWYLPDSVTGEMPLMFSLLARKPAA